MRSCGERTQADTACAQSGKQPVGSPTKESKELCKSKGSVALAILGPAAAVNVAFQPSLLDAHFRTYFSHLASSVTSVGATLRYSPSVRGRVTIIRVKGSRRGKSGGGTTIGASWYKSTLHLKTCELCARRPRVL